MSGRIGFTGTQEGMTPNQYASVTDLVRSVYQTAKEFHHGDCVGADAQLHGIVVEFYVPIVIHPPLNGSKRAHCMMGNVRFLPPKDYLARNADIVSQTDQLVATPRAFEEEQRSGTWATVRMARRAGKPVTIVWPDGRVSVDSEASS